VSDGGKKVQDSSEDAMLEQTQGVRAGGFRQAAYSDCYNREFSQKTKVTKLTDYSPLQGNELVPRIQGEKVHNLYSPPNFKIGIA